jgi:hypothetical protein
VEARRMERETEGWLFLPKVENGRAVRSQVRIDLGRAVGAG